MVSESKSPESEIEIGFDQKFEFRLVARSSSQAAERFYSKECDLVFEFLTADQVSDFRSRENQTVSLGSVTTKIRSLGVMSRDLKLNPSVESC